MNNSLINYFNNINNISHAFLIGNVSFDEIKNELNEIIKDKILICEKLDILNNPDIYYLNQDKSSIKKDEIKQLLNELSKTSQVSNTKIYIINGCENLSDTVYNSILKTLEEPENNIYAFLITKNLESIKDTIKSRCQKIYFSSNIKKEYDTNLYELSDMFTKLIEDNNIKSIALFPNIYTEISDRDTFKNILNIMLEKYNNNLKKIVNNQINNKENNEILKNNDIISLSKKILVIDNSINLLNNYLNKNSSIDRFIIEMWRCNK